jgi:xeroderma pigmentosum group C-complementing protein
LQEGDVAQLTELYGEWQTEPWVPPAAENGVVPKNERGNVEVPPLAQALPAGTTHLDFPRVFHACRRLGVDFAPALVGFEPARGGMLPKFAGVVVCDEFADAVTQSAAEEQAALEAKARQKRCAQCPACA